MLWIFGIFVLIALVVWGVLIYRINNMAYHQKEEYYSMGEEVELGNNFFDTIDENMNGYSIKVNSATLKKYRDYLQSFGKTKSEIENISEIEHKYVCLLNVTISNKDSDDGRIVFNQMALYNGAVQIPIDFSIWNIIDPKIDGNTAIRLKKNSKVDIVLPFLTQDLDEIRDSDKLNCRLENGEFDMCVCDFPVRKLIKVKFEK